jgi:hypothetical protein
MNVQAYYYMVTSGKRQNGGKLRTMEESNTLSSDISSEMRCSGSVAIDLLQNINRHLPWHLLM